jgi:hypothetical protein
LALCPNFNVLLVSSSLKIEGEQVIINDVLELPPSVSYSMWVNLESLYGICDDLPSVSLKITKPRVVSDLLIFYASFKPTPTTPVFEILSLPARSTKKILPVFEEKSLVFFCSI